jgi:hypothetical protein
MVDNERANILKPLRDGSEESDVFPGGARSAKPSPLQKSEAQAVRPRAPSGKTLAYSGTLRSRRADGVKHTKRCITTIF